MLEPFVISLREGVEAALVVGLLLASLARAGRSRLRPAVYAGLAAAIAASVGVGATFALVGIDAEHEAVEGALLLASAAFVASMVVWMARHGRRLKGEIERRVEALAPREAAGARVGVFVFTFLMVGREGVELVAFLAATRLTTAGIVSLFGALAGLAVAVGLGVALARGAVRVDLRRFFAVTSAVLLVFAAELLVLAFHEFVEAGVIPLRDPERYMRAVGPLVRNRALFGAAMILLPLAFLVGGRRAREAVDAVGAAARKRLAAARAERAARFGLASLSLLALFALGAHAVSASRALELSPPEMLVARGGEVRVAASGLEEGRVRRFGVTLGDRVVRFLLLRSGDSVRAAFDACRLCRDEGYVQHGEHLVCRNCVAEIVAPTLGTEGGCNPIPVSSRVEGSEVVVRLDDLAREKDLFAPGSGAPADPELECPYCAMRFRAAASGGEAVVGGRTRPVCDMEACVRRAAISRAADSSRGPGG